MALGDFQEIWDQSTEPWPPLPLFDTTTVFVCCVSTSSSLCSSFLLYSTKFLPSILNFITFDQTKISSCGVAALQELCLFRTSFCTAQHSSHDDVSSTALLIWDYQHCKYGSWPLTSPTQTWAKGGKFESQSLLGVDCCGQVHTGSAPTAQHSTAQGRYKWCCPAWLWLAVAVL